MFGGFRGILHNDASRILYHAFKESGFKDVRLEPALQPLTGEKLRFASANTKEDARSDISVMGFWRPNRRAFFDITAFSPYAPTYSSRTFKSVFQSRERTKFREYGDRIHKVEHGDFSPLVFSTSGSLGPQASMVVKKLWSFSAKEGDLSLSNCKLAS